MRPQWIRRTLRTRKAAHKSVVAQAGLEQRLWRPAAPSRYLCRPPGEARCDPLLFLSLSLGPRGSHAPRDPAHLRLPASPFRLRQRPGRNAPWTRATRRPLRAARRGRPSARRSLLQPRTVDRVGSHLQLGRHRLHVMSSSRARLVASASRRKGLVSTSSAQPKLSKAERAPSAA